MSMSYSADFDIRYTEEGDLFYLKSWLDHPSVMKWFPISDEKEINDAAACWIGFYKFKCSLTAIVNGIPCGMATLFLMPYKKVAHESMFKIVVSPEYQRQGIGSALIKNLKHLAKKRFRLELLHIEVYENNPLIELLEKQGFQAIVRQERYFKDDDTYFARVLLEGDIDKEDHGSAV